MIQDYTGTALSAFAGLPVFDFTFAADGDGGLADRLAEVPSDVDGWAWRVGMADADSPSGAEIWANFLETVDTTKVRALLLGMFDEEAGESAEAFGARLTADADRFPDLAALFLHDLAEEDSEVSWIEAGDVSAVLSAFPGLRILGVRCGESVEFTPVRHANLRELTFQSGGLGPAVIGGVLASDLPALTGLDLYLGTAAYGGGAGPEVLGPLLSGTAFPALRHLGLRNAESIDELAPALAHAPVVAALTSLDLSLGMLDDAGAAALLSGQPLTHLTDLDLHHHFLSPEMCERVRAALPGVRVDVRFPCEARLSQRGEPRRYISIAE